MESVGKMMLDVNFFHDKRIFITGHTGFKGSWLCYMLLGMGAKVSGYSLEPPTKPNLFTVCGIEKNINSVIGDIRDFNVLKQAFNQCNPEIVFHLAAQPLVRESYKNPRYTYETNVMGTVNLLECIRTVEIPPRSIVNITTDKVYKNNEWIWGYRENEPLDGFDPYSNSKSCSELVTHSYKNSFFSENRIAVSTARAGNVIGGGDFANDRILPDCIRAAQRGEKIMVRNPASIRPYQHVLEPLHAYLMIAQKQYEDINYADYYNIGPDDHDCVPTAALVQMFCEYWGNGQSWENISEINPPHEAHFLKLDCSKIKDILGWKPIWNIDTAVGKTVEWTKAYFSKEKVSNLMDRQIKEFLQE